MSAVVVGLSTRSRSSCCSSYSSTAATRTPSPHSTRRCGHRRRRLRRSPPVSSRHGGSSSTRRPPVDCTSACARYSSNSPEARLRGSHGMDLAHPAAPAVLGEALWAIVRPDARCPGQSHGSRLVAVDAAPHPRSIGNAVTATLPLVQTRLHATAILDEVERAIVGKRPILELLLAGMLADGHILLEDFPGVAKTLIARSFSEAIGASFTRIQFTPDLLPGDITGSSIYDARTAQFEFRPRSGLHQPAARRRDQPRDAEGTVGAARGDAGAPGHRRRRAPTSLERPFLVLATQNPIELEGTYPLPEAQLDRFMLRLSVGYPTEARRMGHRAAPARATSGTSGPARGRRPRHVPRDAGIARGRLRVRCGRPVRRRDRALDPRARHGECRRQPARHAGGHAGGAGRRGTARTRLRDARRREDGRGGRARAPCIAASRALDAGHTARAGRAGVSRFGAAPPPEQSERPRS